jgi:hypothetical protein
MDRKLDSLLGKQERAWKELLDAICGSADLMSCSDVVSFDATAQLLIRDVSRGPAEFAAYFASKPVPLLRANAAAGRNTWTNNNCEAVNHLLKQYTQWQTQQLPDLVLQKCLLRNGQHIETDRALIGHGDFDLQPAFVTHRFTVDAWEGMLEKQRSKASNGCFRWPTVPPATPTEGTFTVPLTPGA